MATVGDFLSKLDEVFGFYFDIGMACHLAKERLESINQKSGVTDDSLFMFKDGPPTGTPEQELEASLHATTLRAVKGRLDASGYDIQKAAETVVVFTYHIWEEKYRGHLIGRDGKPLGKVSSEVMGDLRLLRNSIIHNKGIANADIAKCRVLKQFRPGEKIVLMRDHIYTVLRAIRTEMSVYA